MPSYLADATIWAWARRFRHLQGKLRERIHTGELATCVPVALEMLHSARDGHEYDRYLTRLQRVAWLPLPVTASRRALAVQRALAHTTHGAHRLPAIDYLVAAVAEEHGAMLWHLDRDLARLCAFAGQSHEHERLPGRAR